MSNNAPSAQTDIDAYKAAVEKAGRKISEMPSLQKLLDALQKLQNQINDLQNQINT